MAVETLRVMEMLDGYYPLLSCKSWPLDSFAVAVEHINLNDVANRDLRLKRCVSTSLGDFVFFAKLTGFFFLINELAGYLMAKALISAAMHHTSDLTLKPNNRKNCDRASLSCSIGNSDDISTKRKLPVLLFDVMDTIVRDPFYEDVPAFFGMSMKELLECKHPTAWIEFEKGLIDEEELARKFFIDGRNFDLEGLKECMRSGYSCVDGMRELLQALRIDDYEIHAFTNYPIWYTMIEDKLKLSASLSWTFCSCNIGKRKPDPEFYLKVVGNLGVEPSDCIFIDDRPKNVKCAMEIGMVGLCFENADSLRKDLLRLGINVSSPRDDWK